MFSCPHALLYRFYPPFKQFPKKSIKVNDEYVDKKDIGNPCFGADVSNNGDKWDLMHVILVKGPTKILKTLLNQFLMVLLEFFQLAGVDKCSLKNIN